MKHKYRIIAAKAILLLILAGAGVAKLMGLPEVHASFATLGLPTWFGYAIGSAEILISIGLLITRFVPLACMAAIIILSGAMYYHLIYTPLADVATALLAFLLSAYLLLSTKESCSINPVPNDDRA